jgi:hypothetical protein
MLEQKIKDYIDKIDVWLANKEHTNHNPMGPFHYSGMAFAYRGVKEDLLNILEGEKELE